ncbi:hypothetical protein GCM10009679_71480 [Saccharothrix algeriensis]|uniref:Uncharacterized protein n=1 Tax=Catellatospora bangladeshensis TaxID=310355 RepID=A0A8J3NNQ4_9ACTN|nr:hypothetical protein Cba03nite_77020 [Catellatospora bangladeshensis]
MVAGAVEPDGAADPVGSGEGVVGVQAADNATSASGTSTRSLSADIPQVYVHLGKVTTGRSAHAETRHRPVFADQPSERSVTAASSAA